PVEEIGGMWQDRLKVRRLKRQIELLKKVQKLIDDSGFEPQYVKDSISIPLLTSATLEDNQTLQDKWAALLANAANPATGVHPAFIRILESMGPLDAAVLDESYGRLLIRLRERGNVQIVYLEQNEMDDVLSFVKQNGGNTALDNVIGLRLL